MKDITLFLTEMLNEAEEVKLNETEEVKESEEAVEETEKSEEHVNEAEESIKDEKAFREYAHAKLKEVFGDDYDEKKADEMVDGILKDNKELVDKDDWGALIGILNKGVAK